MTGSRSPGDALSSRARHLLAVVLLAVAVGCTAPQDEPTAEDRIGAAVREQVDSDPVYDNVRAIVVSVDGETILEEYYGSSPDEYWPVQSVTKSVVATLVGIAVDQGLLRLDQPLDELLPSYRDRMRPRQATLTLEQVLTMTAGFPSESAIDARIFQKAADPVTASLDLWTGSVGEHVYSNAGAHLLSAILAEATGGSVLDYAREELFDPLGIDTEPAHEPLARPEAVEEYLAADFAWPVDRQGRHLAWAWLKLTPRDLLKLGELYLAGGEWEGEQVVSSDWVAAATGEQVDAAGGVLNNYGYQWWVGVLDGEPAALAWGYGGQAVAVVPSQELVAVVSTEVDFLEAPGATTRGLSPGLVKILIELAVMRNLDPLP
jgi:CubicO group peptidase (beta-lactamase class C family)